MDTLTSPTSVVFTGALFLGTFLLYRWLLPKPIPGIPYEKNATNTIFGDIPSMMDWLKTHKALIPWMLAYNERHNSPIVQIFTQLFGKPWVIISDYREVQVSQTLLFWTCANPSVGHPSTTE
jgi:hypothetical protein